MHEYKFDEIEDAENLGGNTKKTKRKNAAAKIPAIVHIPTQRVIVNLRVEVIQNTRETRKGMKFRNRKQLDELTNIVFTEDTTARRIHIDDIN